MADYIYLLQTRLTGAQQAALESVRYVARAHNLTVFLVGGAVRDLTSGAPVRDLDVAVQGNALSLRKELESRGAITLGSDPVFQTLHLSLPGGVRLGVESTLSVTYPKPGKPVVASANILDDLRRRDFTANAMAISLNEGSYGLLMDPLNGVADIENRELRLVSNYGFIEDPARMLRGVRLAARSGWQFEEKTQGRYEIGKAEGYISAMQPSSRSYELEDIFHEEDPLRVLRRMEEEGWAKEVFPALQSAKANEAELERLRDLVDQLQTMGIFPDPAAANFPLLTAKMAPKDVAELKKGMARPGFVEQIEALEASTKEFASRFTAKHLSAPSDTWKLLLSSPPEQVLWLAFSSKSPGVQARFKAFFEDWPSARQRIPYQIMQEMRITPDLPGYNDLLESLFFAIMDGKLETLEATRAFLEPFSPPAPPPPVNVRRRPAKRESKTSRKAKPTLEVSELEETGSAMPTPAGEPLSSKSEPIVIKEAPAKKPASAKPSPTEKKAATKQESLPSASPQKQGTSAKAPVKTAKAPAKAAKKAATSAPAEKKPPIKAAAGKSATTKPAGKQVVKKAVPPARPAAKRPSPSKPAAKGKVAVKPAASPAKKPAARGVAKKAVERARR